MTNHPQYPAHRPGLQHGTNETVSQQYSGPVGHRQSYDWRYAQSPPYDPGHRTATADTAPMRAITKSRRRSRVGVVITEQRYPLGGALFQRRGYLQTALE